MLRAILGLGASCILLGRKRLSAHFGHNCRDGPQACNAILLADGVTVCGLSFAHRLTIAENLAMGGLSLESRENP
jgi:hypothetical protein